jgi:hypothetical protein
MLANFYYFIGLFILICSFSNLINFFKFSKIRHWISTYQKVTNEDVSRKDFRKIEEYNIFTIYSIFTICEFVWFLIGLVSNSWYIFLSLILLSFTTRLIAKLLNHNVLYNTLGFTIQFIKFSAILILILNHFHFHLDWIELLGH